MGQLFLKQNSMGKYELKIPSTTKIPKPGAKSHYRIPLAKKSKINTKSKPKLVSTK